VEHRKDILWRTYLVYIFMVVFALSIVYRIVLVQFVQGDMWKEKAKQLTTMYHDIEATRGNIFDVNGNLLATSLPYYEVGMDVNAPSIVADTFNKYVDSLAYRLAETFKDKEKRDYKRVLKAARESKDRYIVLKRNVSYKDLQLVRTFPILRKGKRGGLVYLQTNHRERPFQMLASRMIGYTRNELKVGIEGAYDSTLKGISGKRLMQKVAADVWRPINDENEVEPKNGNDVYTTIDINIQDVAENALKKQLIKNGAKTGCVILMEVKTGEIRAIANLAKDKGDSTSYSEQLNIAIVNATEPGSTFKLASLLAAMDDGYVDLDDIYHVGNGECMYYDKKVKDSHPPESPDMSVQRIFETSSNVGVTKIITKYYSKDPQKYIDKLLSYNLGKPLGLGIPGEGQPLIKKVKDFSGVTLPQMSYGYELLVTPMQTLTLYNAVANNGCMVRPRFIKKVMNNGVVVKDFEPEVINPQIAKPSAIEKAKKMLEGVVRNGTGKGLNVNAFQVAGKTGTAQIAKGGTYGHKGEHVYQASFVGYFPAEKPLYTCIVIINEPSKGDYYGGLVSGPVFKEIAEKVYSSSLEFHQGINDKKVLLTQAPAMIKGKKSDVINVLSSLNIPFNNGNIESEWVSKSEMDSTKISLAASNPESALKKGTVPNLSGMSAKDALFLLENNGLNVRLEGIGTVKKQSLEAGVKFFKGSQIVLTLG
jgi:cell division protein FtsI (penicillin-binding protein 3)